MHSTGHLQFLFSSFHLLLPKGRQQNKTKYDLRKNRDFKTKLPIFSLPFLYVYKTVLLSSMF